MEQRCEERGARLLDFVVDFGAAKGSTDEYPVLSYLRGGRADVLLVVRVPVFNSRPSGYAPPDGRHEYWTGAEVAKPLQRDGATMIESASG